MRQNGNQTYPGTIPDKLQPHNLEAEEAYIGSILIDPDTLIHTAGLNIEPGDCFIERNGWILAAAKHLLKNKAPVDIVSLSDELTRRKQLEAIGGTAYLSRLTNTVPSSIDGHYYGEIVKRTSVLRQLIAGAGEISRLAFSGEIDAQEAIEKSTEILLNISKQNTRQTKRSLADLGQQFLTRLDRLQDSANGLTGLPTSLTDLDHLTGGLQRGDYIVLAGRPRMGKSSLALQIMLEDARKYQAKSIIFTREMSEESLHQRMVAYESSVDLQRIRNGQIKDDEYRYIIEATERLASYPIIIDSESATPEAMRARAIVEKERHGLDLVVVDYIQRVTPPSGKKYGSKTHEIGDISAGLNRIAKDLNVPLVAISSLSRACESRNDKHPHLSDLRESGDLEYDADVAMFIYRDEVYNPDGQFPNIADIYIEKQRQGPEGEMSAYFQKHLTKFKDLEVRTEPLDWVN